MALFPKKETATPAVDLSGLESAASAEQPKLSPPPAALTPEVMAFMNASISATVKELFASMGPLLQSIALTPEKMAEAERLRRAPTEEQLQSKDREKRERVRISG